MTDPCIGRIAVSLQGHDRGELYLILEADEDAVKVSDGRLKPAAKPKKKNRRNGCLAPHTSVGCLWRSVAYTLLLLLLYSALGFLLQCT